MRLRLMLCGLTTLASALLLTGCGANVNQASTAVTGNQESPGISGRAFGGEQPVAGATIEVVAMGSSGYGSTGTVLASTTTDANGNFSFASSPYTCPQPDTPVYLLGIGGSNGSSSGTPNPNAVLAAGLGTCTDSLTAYVKMNEVTTVALAYSLAHFFSPTLGSAGANDWFGGPSTTSNGTIAYSKGLVMGNSYTRPTLVDNVQGYPITSADYTVEWQKIVTIANILQNCVNSAGGTAGDGTPCGNLFSVTTNGTSVPSDTLQAAVMMALHPSTNVGSIFGLIPSTPAFPGQLSTAPNDWSIGVSYPTSSVGLAVNTGAMSTLDIDASGKIWFPSNTTGHIGVAYFDPTNRTFNGPFNTTGMINPQQVAIDANGYAWLSDTSSAVIPAYLTTSPTTTQAQTFLGAVSNSLTVRGDNTVSVGVTLGGTNQMANIGPDRSTFSLLTGVTFPYPQTSMAGDITNGVAVDVTNTTSPTMQNYYVTPAPVSTNIVNATDYSGQAVYTGNDNLAVESYAGSGSANDGLCIYSVATCYPLTVNGSQVTYAAKGMAVDGGSQLWIAASGNGSVLQVPVNNPGGTAGAKYLNPSTSTDVPAIQLLHNATAIGGGTATAPVGVGVDAEGNVWMTNANCIGTGCTATGNFTLTEIVGAGFPTITPVSAQITSGTNLVGTEPNQ